MEALWKQASRLKEQVARQVSHALPSPADHLPNRDPSEHIRKDAPGSPSTLNF
jgi:hypothetical protein